MSEYKLTATEEPCAVIRYSDGAYIPPDMANSDYAGSGPFSNSYLKWKDAGGIPDPYVPPEPTVPEPSDAQVIAYDHENRLRTLEGQPPLTLGEFMAKKGASVPTPTKKRK